MKTTMIFVKMHVWIGCLIDFNQAKYNEECTVYSGVSKCFEVGTNSGKAGGCDNRYCLSWADCYDQRSRRHAVKQPAELWSLACFETPVCLLIINTVIEWEIWLQARSWKELWTLIPVTALQEGSSGARHFGILGFAYSGDDDDDL